MEHKHTNRLINEKSPYLLQHSHNPVNWYPWSNEALMKAKEENKPIFLSIGYSTCHWCHVMERESFEDIEVAEILNKDFISIKVDREERPDIDAIYMNVCQSITGSGGWPLTIFLTPGQKPFYAGTYFPRTSTYNHPGLIEILNHIIRTWKNSKDILINSSNAITELINRDYNVSDRQVIKFNILEKAFDDLANSFDDEYGGFDYSPKFPMPITLHFLIRYYYLNKNNEALAMLTETLEHIYRGGIYDHIGFGFSRYSTDYKWLVPHFEKMLYDNALLSMVYTEVYQETKRELFKQIAEDIYNYILRDMASKEGGFYSSEDADSEGIEGKFYVWTYDEIIDILGYVDGNKFCEQYNITIQGNFDGKNIPNLIGSENTSLNEDIRKRLFDYRNKRIHPFKDDKILTSWNGLMIASLAIGGRIFNNKEYIDASIKAVDFIYNNLFNKDGRLLARYRDKEASILGYVDDYAFLIWGLIELYESTFDPQYLQKVIKLNDDLIKYFYDKEHGGLFLYGIDGESLISRPKELYDGVMPSANSVSTMNWLKLFNLTGNKDFKEYAIKQFEIFGDIINNNPTTCLYFLSSYLFATSKTKEIVIVGDNNNEDTNKMINIINSKYNPYITVLLKDDKNVDLLQQIVPFVASYVKKDNKTTAYICSDKTCSKPITNINDFQLIL